MRRDRPARQPDSLCGLTTGRGPATLDHVQTHRLGSGFGRRAPPVLASTDQDTVIYYDTGNTVTWWCSDRDSFGAGVKFTPSEYPCEIIGARAEINYDGGREIYLRVWDDDGQGGLPGNRTPSVA